MTINELISILENRLATNARERHVAAERGDLALVEKLEADSLATSQTIAALKAAIQE